MYMINNIKKYLVKYNTKLLDILNSYEFVYDDYTDKFMDNIIDKFNTYNKKLYDGINIIDDLNYDILMIMRKHIDISNRVSYRKLLRKLFSLFIIITINSINDNNDYLEELYYKYMSILSKTDNDNEIITEYRCMISSLCDILLMYKEDFYNGIKV